ncbi:hypothetical protein PSN45_002323 [Yamadazyma tenuis]|uniref:VHS domain-containing protein n=1 Tax=Candida tenuis (strain ATCC 10573 / BCRC 21748 / CBS 615 / JCM 9827 / NBRC 10315 / NRRL Y-1498 / VKM Y-70) TaxID=590646 RepID=G3BEQ7_CANTC|nr:uncharacterized protein CANTEDRAFT_126624 [Yamadazyma tenuis ATCC 10573]EGV59952.1 hypothetical protein CANTEDRAFT_126624 [Yamadazyma tenuis ATCC 10573]WEJ94823.1 hypothetical protein PSN45_002323 [Yamadazyma tenuis]
MAIFSDHPYTSITVKIEQLARPHQNDDIDNALELYISDLLHLIKLQPQTGASEAARAIRKRIKYGESVEEQLRALNILELLILNAGSKIGPIVARDDKLLDVLKGSITGSGKTGMGVPFDPEVQQKTKELAAGWKSELADLEGYKYMASLWKFIPRNRSGGHHHSRTRSESHRYDDETPENAFDDADGVRSPSPSSPALRRGIHKKVPPPRPSSSSPYTSTSGTKSRSTKDKRKKKKKKRGHGIVYADEQYRIPQINYKVEAPNIRSTLADAQTHTTALNNYLILLAPGVSPLDDQKTQQEFEKCKKARRSVLKYLQYVGAGDPSEKSREVLQMDEEFLGSLIAANESLVEVFKKFDFQAGYTDENPAPNYDDEESSGESYYTSESEDESNDVDALAENVRGYHVAEGSSSTAPVSAPPRVKSPPPPRPSKPAALAAPPKIQRTNTNATVSSDPFGDLNEVDGQKSVYY